MADTLRLDYRDPFLQTATAMAPTVRSVAVTPIQDKMVEQMVDPPAFTYTGMICKDRMSYYIFTVGDTQTMIRLGESINEYRLVSGCGDSVQIFKASQTYILKAQL